MRGLFGEGFCKLLGLATTVEVVVPRSYEEQLFVDKLRNKELQALKNRQRNRQYINKPYNSQHSKMFG